jgi:signal transduction histidine kinase/ligand-binding sensor domain-containing protein/CheY-like chemotaxis protein/AraC-like DNA-binding protein
VRHNVIIFFLAIVSLAVKAQENDFNFVNFNSKDGLSSNTVNAVLKDRFGYMWFGTDEGLNRFNGLSFFVYKFNAADSTSIPANRVLALYEDRSGNFWVGTNKGLSAYDRKRNAFRNFDVTRGAPARSICEDRLGNLWIGGYTGLIRYNPVTHKSTTYKGTPGVPGELRSNTITSIFEDSRQRLWIGSNTGLYLYQPATNNFHVFSSDKSNSSISDNSIIVITEDREGRLWVGTSDGGLNVLLPGSTVFKSFKSIANQPATLSSNRIYCIAQASNGKLWIGTENGLDIFDPNTWKAQRITNNIRNAYSIKGKSVRSIFIDKNGIYWVGTFQSGVNKYDKNLTFFNLVQSNLFDPFGLSSPKVTAFAEADKGDVYVGTDGGGLNLYHPRSGLFEHLAIGRAPLTVMALERIGNELWIGTFLQGIYVLNTRNGSVRHYSEGHGPTNLSSNEIFCIRKDRIGNVWIGTNGKGVDIYNPASGTFHRFSSYVAAESVDKPSDNGFIRGIEEDSTGNIWIGMFGIGVAVYNTELKTFRIFGRNTGLPLDDVQTLLPGKKDIIWAGTSGNGLCRLDYKNNRYKRFTEAEGLANPAVYKILEDDAGKLWLSTNKGISCFDPVNTTFKNYTSGNGLQRSSFYLGAGLCTSGGEMFFGGLDGFNYFSPNKLHYNTNIPVVVFTGLKVSNQHVMPGPGAAISEDISIAREIRLNYKQNFSLDFAALDYTSPHECQYLYKLEGFDKTWNRIGTSGTAVFTNLDPGNYMLKVKAFNPNDSWTTRAAEMSIYVKPPFWRTGYAYVFYFIFTGFVLWGARHRAIHKLKQKFAAEEERRKIRQLIEDERNEAERQRAFDHVRIKFLTNLSHEFRTPVSLIMGPVETLLNKEKDTEKMEQLSMVKRNARRLLNLVNQLLDFRKLEEQELRLNATPGDMAAFVREVADSFRDLADRRHIQFTLNCSVDSYFTSFDKDKIERVLFNLLSNAFKFTGQDGQISLDIRQPPGNDGIIIRVADTGAGMSEEEQHRIFDRFFQGETQAGIMNQGSGIGLSIAKEFVRLHRGTISVESSPGKGSVFIVSLPCQQILQSTASIEECYHAREDSLPVNHVERNNSIPEHKKLIVLLIEDNDDFRLYLKNNLIPYYRIIEASDGKEGWQKTLSAHPQVIVSDINMPGMDGITLSRKIKSDKRTSHIPIILLTALTGDAYHLKGLQTGASDYLTKPFNFNILNVKIKNLVAQSQRLRNTYSRQLKIDTPEVTIESNDEKLILSITKYIEANIDNPDLSVEELSKHVFMSRGTLYTKMMNLTGETPVEYIKSIKLNKAAAILEKNSAIKIAEVAYAAGFTSPNYFAKAFKSKFNVSPTEYANLKKGSGGTA